MREREDVADPDPSGSQIICLIRSQMYKLMGNQ